MTIPVFTPRRITAALGAGVLILGLTACGSSADDSTTQTPSGGQQQSENGSGGQGTAGGQGFPGANGEVVAVSGSTAQVQSQANGQATGQTAVSWTGSTTFTQQVSAKLADVTTGSCVMVQSGADSAASSDGDTIAAGTVRITAASDGSCAMGGFGGGRAGQGGQAGPGGQMPRPPEGMPSGGPSDMPQGGADGRRGGAFGMVTGVSASGFTVESSLPSAPGAPGSEDDGDDDATRTTTVTVTVGADTTYTKQVSAQASDVKVGVCVQAQGEPDDVGALSATTVAISQPVDGGCGAFGFRSRGNDQGGAGRPGDGAGQDS